MRLQSRGRLGSNQIDIPIGFPLSLLLAVYLRKTSEEGLGGSPSEARPPFSKADHCVLQA